MPATGPFAFIAILILFFCSGAVALMYEVFWMKELGLLFGNTTYAAATTLTAFFAGLSAGGFFGGHYAGRVRDPLRVYGWLEIGIVLTASGYFFLLDGYRTFYPLLFESFSGNPLLFLALKFILALVFLFAPAFFMGATLPMMSQFLVRGENQMGKYVSALYAMNTLGATIGALVAGFYLPRYFGFTFSYHLTMVINLLIAGSAIALSFAWKGHQSVAAPPAENSTNSMPETATTKDLVGLRWLAFISGVVTLALQVLWTRMFSQVMQNSVYTFAIIVVVFLLILALSAGLAHILMRWRISPTTLLSTAIISGALLVFATPYWFTWLTDDLQYAAGGSDWNDYVLDIFKLTLLTIGPALLCLGLVLPLLFKLAESHWRQAGQIIGQLAAINTLGAIAGSFLGGFVILELMGLWNAMQLIGSIYLLALFMLTFTRTRIIQRYSWVPAGMGLITLLLTGFTPLPVVVHHEAEQVVELWEGSAGHVAVTRYADALKIKVNNHYTLGGSGAFEAEEAQTDIPLLVHGKAKDVYLLGLGSGITAGAALKYPIESLTVTELIPDVINASRGHFGPYLHGLFNDSRAQVIAEDGRNFLAGARQRYDVIIADLLVPWRAGAGYLHTLEHFQTVRERLRSDGVFMQ